MRTLPCEVRIRRSEKSCVRCTEKKGFPRDLPWIPMSFLELFGSLYFPSLSGPQKTEGRLAGILIGSLYVLACGALLYLLSQTCLRCRP